jgi:hypothetical protein
MPEPMWSHEDEQMSFILDEIDLGHGYHNGRPMLTRFIGINETRMDFTSLMQQMKKRYEQG